VPIRLPALITTPAIITVPSSMDTSEATSALGWIASARCPSAVENQQSELPTEPRFADRNQDIIVLEKFGLLEAATATQKRNFADKRSRWLIVQKSRQGSTCDPESVGDHAALATIDSPPEDDMIYPFRACVGPAFGVH
jgi:hypothetical protein